MRSRLALTLVDRRVPELAARLHSFLDAAAAEAASLPLPGLQGRIVVRWDT